MKKVLVVDDSVVYRTQIKAALQNVPGLEVVATASNGQIALDRLSLTPVDFVVLDLEMPILDGISTIKEMKRLGIKSKIIVFSSISKRGAEITMEALALGASDFVTKPDGSETLSSPMEAIKSLLLPKIMALASQELPSLREKEIAPKYSYSPKIIWELYRPKIIVIGSSTGGPTVLENIFSKISAPFDCPIVIAQHMPPLFTATLVERLGKLCGAEAKEAEDFEVLQKNKIYIAPGNYHLRLQGSMDDVRLRLSQDEKINFVRPAVDPLFETAASIYKGSCLGIILTGMGQDGKIGAEAVKKHGGAVIIQEEKSCVVFGMPGAVFNSGFYDKIYTPDEVALFIHQKVASHTPLKNGKIG